MEFLKFHRILGRSLTFWFCYRVARICKVPLVKKTENEPIGIEGEVAFQRNLRFIEFLAHTLNFGLSQGDIICLVSLVKKKSIKTEREFKTEHEKGWAEQKKPMFIPLHSTHMYMLLVYSDKIRTRNMAMP